MLELCSSCMVLFVEVDRKELNELRKWRYALVDFVRLDTMEWLSLQRILFLATSDEYLHIMVVFPGINMTSITYTLLEQLNLKISALQRQYYDYHGWCFIKLYPLGFCVPNNSYKPYALFRKINLRPTKSLYTIVPTQMSSFI